MTPRPRNSMATALTFAMTAIIWVSVVLGAFAFVVLAIGLVASLNGGAMSLPIVDVAADIGPASFLFLLAALAIILPGVIYVCLQLRRILATLAAGDPFVPDNARRLTRIAIALGIMEIASILAVLLTGTVLPHGSETVRPTLSINLTVWAAIAALLILSQVFREGTRLREEEKMTI